MHKLGFDELIWLGETENGITFWTLLNFVHAEKKFGKKGTTIVMADGSQVEELNVLRENDQLFIF